MLSSTLSVECMAMTSHLVTECHGVSGIPASSVASPG